MKSLFPFLVVSAILSSSCATKSNQPSQPPTYTISYAPGTVGNLNDLWKFSGGQWTWVSGSNVGSQNSTFGSKGTLDPANAPGARNSLTHWTDSQGNLWLLGGYGQMQGTTGNLNDLWMYMP